MILAYSIRELSSHNSISSTPFSYVDDSDEDGEDVIAPIE